MDLHDATTWLDGHLALGRPAPVAGRPVPEQPVERMRDLAGTLGHPQEAYPVIHVTGTNGKGSTARMITALLVEQSLRVGTYTSPQLEHITERITVDLEPISAGELAKAIETVASAEARFLAETSRGRPSYFEAMTAAALLHFARAAVDVAVVEVGVLGRFDATNVVEADVAVVTNVGLDHTDGADGWRSQVAYEKAGIVTPGRPLILGETDADLVPVFSRERPAPVWLRERDFGVANRRPASPGQVVDLWTPWDRHDAVVLPVPGAHHAQNAACAVAAAEAFLDRPLDDSRLRAALAGVTLPGRFEVLRRDPLVVLDSAHNPDGARALAQTLADELGQTARRRWVVGLLRGRDPGEMLTALGIRPGDHVVAATPEPRGVPGQEVAAAAERLGATTELVADVRDALPRALAAADQGDGAAVVVTGTVYLVGPARSAARRLDLGLGPDSCGQ